CQSGICVNGDCTCSPGALICNGVCTNIQTDAYNCGACGKRCAYTDECVAGACKPRGCPAGQVMATGYCVDLNWDWGNCGTVGNACAGGQVCANGACASSCPAS